MGEKNIVLIVDDMEINRIILAEYLKDEYTILEADDGIKALEIIRIYQDEIAVVLLDRLMPRMGGFQVMEQLAEDDILKKTPFVLITGDYSLGEGEMGYLLGISEIITKPFEPFVVKKRVDNIIELYRYRNKESY